MSVVAENARISIARILTSAYKDFCESRLLSDEIIFASVNFTSTVHFGFYIVTSYRLLRVSYEASRRRPRVHYRTTAPLGSVGVRYKMYWYPDIVGTGEFLTRRELARSYIEEDLLSEIRRCDPADYVCEYRGKQIPLTEIALNGGNGDAFTRDDGRYIYELIQKAIRAGGKLEQVSVPVDQESDRDLRSPTELLRQIASLRNAEILTQDEFEKAKAKILKRL